MAAFTRVVVPKPTTDVPESLPTVPIPRGGLLLRSYINGWPLTILCLSWNVIVSSTLSTPPDSDNNLASKLNSLFLSAKTGSNTAPLPLPPSIVADNTLWIPNFCGSTWTLVTLPVITGLIRAVVFPIPGFDSVISGGFTTS